MKKFFALFAALTLVLCAGSAFAFTWQDVEAAECTEYIIDVTKYVKTDADLGTAYTAAPGASAKVGDIVYFDIAATDVHGEEVEAIIETHHLSDIKAVGSIFSAKVVGAQPWVKASITEKTALAELTYDGKPIHASGSSVVIGDLVFTRNEKGVVSDVHSNLNTAEMLKELAALGIDIEELYDGKLCMSDDILIANFGQVCETSDSAAWYVAAAAEPDMDIPKTGDTGVLGLALLCLSSAAAMSFKRRK